MPLECTACDVMVQTGEVAEETATVVASTSFVLSMLLSMAKNVLFSLIGMMQLYVYLPLYSITFPGNLQKFLLFFMDIASGDLFTSEEMFMKWFFFNPVEGLDSYNDNFDALGFGTSNIIFNMGDLAVI